MFIVLNMNDSDQGGTEIILKMCNISRIMSADCTQEKKECSVAVNYSPNMLKPYGSAEVVTRQAGQPLSGMSSSSFLKRNSPSTGICLGILCFLLQVIAVMYQTC